jgi:hypothetical protein
MLWMLYPCTLLATLAGFLVSVMVPDVGHELRRRWAWLRVGSCYVHHRVKHHRWVRYIYSPAIAPRGRMPVFTVISKEEWDETSSDSDSDDMS